MSKEERKNLFCLISWEKKSYGTETFSIDIVSNKEHFHGKKQAQNVYQKVVPDPFLILVNNPKQPCMQKTILKIRYFVRGLSKSFQKLTLFFCFEPSPF